MLLVGLLLRLPHSVIGSSGKAHESLLVLERVVVPVDVLGGGGLESSCELVALLLEGVLISLQALEVNLLDSQLLATAHGHHSLRLIQGRRTAVLPLVLSPVLVLSVFIAELLVHLWRAGALVQLAVVGHHGGDGQRAQRRGSEHVGGSHRLVSSYRVLA